MCREYTENRYYRVTPLHGNHPHKFTLKSRQKYFTIFQPWSESEMNGVRHYIAAHLTPVQFISAHNGQVPHTTPQKQKNRKKNLTSFKGIQQVLKCVKSTPLMWQTSFTCSLVIIWIQTSCLIVVLECLKYRAFDSADCLHHLVK